MDSIFFISEQKRKPSALKSESVQHKRIYLNFSHLCSCLQLDKKEMAEVIQKGQLSELLKSEANKISAILIEHDVVDLLENLEKARTNGKAKQEV